MKGADRLILATDPDREGEAISWHVLQALTQRRAHQGRQGAAGGVQRHHPLGSDRGDGASARHRHGAGRRLPGPPRARLSGRVHALAGAVAQAAGRALGGTRAVGGAAPDRRSRDRDRGVPDRGVLDRRRRRLGRCRSVHRPAGQAPGQAASANSTCRTRPPRPRPPRPPCEAATFKVSAVEKKSGQAHPPPPFTTSTLQQEAARKLGFSAQRTMQAAQRLYEGIDVGGETRRADHLHAHRRRSVGARGADRGPQRHRRALRRVLRAREPAPLPHQGQERPGGARGDPADQPGPQPRARCGSSPTSAGSTS